jgi:tetratricopeptide (TPR) repeat protein
MSKDYNEDFDDFNGTALNESARKFESMIQNNESHYLDEITYESLSNFYIDNNRWDLAEKACDLGLQQYPYSLELLLNQSQLFVNTLAYDQALEMLERA